MTMVQSDRPFARPIATFGTIRWEQTGSNLSNISGPTGRPWRGCSNAYGSPVRHRSKNVSLYKQHDIIFILNARPERFTQAFERVVVC